MTSVVAMFDDAERADQLQAALVATLRATGKITSEAVATAFQRVPRHKFVPAGTPLEVVYAVDNRVPTKRDQQGVIVSSVSAAYIQARMIEQAQLRPGARVLEIGSGGCNAALIAEVVGPDGPVITVDIDPDVTDRASALLDATGYGSRVTVMQADGAYGAAEAAPYDAILVTVGAWDIPPAWQEQLADDGKLVVPLIMNGVTRSIAFRRQGGHLVSTDVEVAGFVAMQGAGQHPERVIPLRDARGRQVSLRFDDGMPEDPGLLDGVLDSRPVEAWSGVTITHGTSFADLHLWLAGFLPGFCRISAEETAELAAERGKSWFPFGAVQGGSVALLAARSALNSAGVEFGARGYGVDGEVVATALVEQIQEWDHTARGRPAPTFAYWPAGSDRTTMPTTAVVLEKAHGLVSITWPQVAEPGRGWSACEAASQHGMDSAPALGAGDYTERVGRAREELSGD